MIDSDKKIINIEFRPFEWGDETKIVQFLNLCFKEWGDIGWWNWLYLEYPTFNKKNIFVIENMGEIIGHRGLVFRELLLNKRSIRAVTMSGTAIHPNFRGSGIYAKMHDATLKLAKEMEASIIITNNLRGGVTYNHNLKTGFVEVECPIYYKILNPNKVISNYLKNERCNPIYEHLVKGLNVPIYLRLSDEKFLIYKPPSNDNKTNMNNLELDVTTDSILYLIRIKNRDRLSLLILPWLFLSGKIHINLKSLISFSSAFIKLSLTKFLRKLKKNLFLIF